MKQKRSKLKSLSEVEWTLMKLCWQQGKTTARNIYEASLKEKQRGYQTVKTMLDRMVEKGYLSRERLGPIWLYEPVIAKKRALQMEIGKFTSTVLDGVLKPVLLHFANHEKLTEEDLETMKQIIREKGGKL
ncbi:MAG TPA: BlaI/MecI/CopY family transcriptional regulator [Verrucomicrobiales bacterium]|nr:BlaI/MecI/CopY family transcriptional regulator [Verrucomicrobiales bacterium]